MQLNKKLLAIIGKRFPAIYDVIPRGPQGGLARVALNPQPLPPHELGAAVAEEFVRCAWVAERGGLDMKALLSDLDDWCPTRPKIPKLPPWWGPFPEPEPRRGSGGGYGGSCVVVTDRSSQERPGPSVHRARIDASVVPPLYTRELGAPG